MMVGWKHRGTFPSLWFNPEQKIDREELAEKDAETKLASKVYADSRRGAKESNVGVGDIVLLAQPKKSKLDPTFSSERFTVIAREGAKVVVMSKSGLQYGRNVREVKKAPESIQPDDTSDEDIQDEDKASHDPQQAPPTSRNLRHTSTIKRPKRYDDHYVYRVFF
ncbi:uncharacterized protein LOC134227878 [Armigeres subalbatus]|uniref:uncharacterized protein LOC134227878 n=1 Tax=Armigeres subalbatus TaxID=124917 RepID=UPI002ED34904